MLASPAELKLQIVALRISLWEVLDICAALPVATYLDRQVYKARISRIKETYPREVEELEIKDKVK